jgi:hypothetical protein
MLTLYIKLHGVTMSGVPLQANPVIRLKQVNCAAPTAQDGHTH